MRYYQCRCGELTSWGSMPPPACLGCPKCGSNLAEGPKAHKPVKEHEFTAHIRQISEAGPIEVPVCRYCWRAKWEIEQQAAGERA